MWAAHDVLAAEGVAIARGTMAETAGDLAAVLRDIAPQRRATGRR